MTLQTHELPDGTLHWDPLRGRGLRTTGTLSAGHHAAIERWGHVDVFDGVWVRNRTSLSVPHGLWAPDPSKSGSDGHPFRLVRLDNVERSILHEVNDARTGEQLLDRGPWQRAHLQTLAAKLTRFDVQALQLRPTRPSPRDRSLTRVLGRTREPNARTLDQHDDDGRTSLTAYHKDAITDGTTHFDDRETTFAHAFGLPHPALHGQRYGARLRQRLGERGWPVHGEVVELGCGTGELAAGWGAPARGTYRRFDLSPELLRVQALAAPWSTGTEADLTHLPVEPHSIPLIVCNEVLADLAAVPVEHADEATERLREQLGIESCATGFYNPGAWRAMVEAARVLAPGGRAVFTEFGVLHGAAEEAVQLDHPEVAIHFGHLARAAESLGLAAEVVRLDDLLGLHPQGRWLARHSWLAVRSWASSRGVRLPARAWTPSSLAFALPDAVGPLDWVPLSDDGPGPLVTRFYALLLHND